MPVRLKGQSAGNRVIPSVAVLLEGPAAVAEDGADAQPDGGLQRSGEDATLHQPAKLRLLLHSAQGLGLAHGCTHRGTSASRGDFGSGGRQQRREPARLPESAQCRRGRDREGCAVAEAPHAQGRVQGHGVLQRTRRKQPTVCELVLQNAPELSELHVLAREQNPIARAKVHLPKCRVNVAGEDFGLLPALHGLCALLAQADELRDGLAAGAGGSAAEVRLLDEHRLKGAHLVSGIRQAASQQHMLKQVDVKPHSYLVERQVRELQGELGDGRFQLRLAARRRGAGVGRVCGPHLGRVLPHQHLVDLLERILHEEHKLRRVVHRPLGTEDVALALGSRGQGRREHARAAICQLLPPCFPQHRGGGALEGVPAPQLGGQLLRELRGGLLDEQIHLPDLARGGTKVQKVVAGSRAAAVGKAEVERQSPGALLGKEGVLLACKPFQQAALWILPWATCGGSAPVGRGRTRRSHQPLPGDPGGQRGILEQLVVQHRPQQLGAIGGRHGGGRVGLGEVRRGHVEARALRHDVGDALGDVAADLGVRHELVDLDVRLKQTPLRLVVCDL
mmetsp:Transcript_73442/g.238874  ORF Transcript_73442/g.238874 Transcript_73442/m.238874 type:complete len:563 (-) Transcript_73442:314-2002(-)